jgi:hypothetical protein
MPSGRLCFRRAALLAAVVGALAVSGATAQIITQNYTATSQDALLGEPPDTMGSVGVRDFAQFINFEFTVFDKSTGAERQRIDPATFWSNAGVDTSSAFAVSDPRVLYDPTSRRWFASMIDVNVDDNGTPTSGNHFLFAVSQTSDPTGAWKGTQFLGDPTGTRLTDFPRLGVNRDGVYLVGDNFNVSGGQQDVPETISIVAYRKSDLLSPTPNFSNASNFFNLDPNNAGIVSQPIVDFGPSTGREPFLAVDFNLFSTLNRYDLVGTTNPTFTATQSITVPATAAPPGAHQPDTPDKIDTNDDRFDAYVFKVGNSIWGVHTTAFPANARTPQAALRWYQIDATTGAMLQQPGTLTDSVSDLYMPSIAANQFGDVVIGYTRSSITEYASAYASIGHTTNGVTTFGSPILLRAGTMAYDPASLGLGADNRWGDYSATHVDPADPWIFFTIQEFADDATDPDFPVGQWATQVSEIVIPHANESRWNAPVSGTITDNSAWLSGAAPGASDHAIFSRATAAGSSYSVTFAGDLTTSELSVRQGTVNLALSGHTYSLTSPATSIAIGEYGGEPQVTFSSGALSSVNTTIAADINAVATVALAGVTWTNSGNFSIAGNNDTQGGFASVTVPADSTLSVGGTLRIWSGGSLAYSASALTAGAIDVNGGQLTMIPAGNHVLLTQSLSIENNGQIDLTDNDAIIHYTGPSPIGAIRALLVSGYNNGTWTGPGLASAAAHNDASHHTALGYAEASDVGVTSLDGHAVDGNTLIIKYTYYGDSSLDGKVDLGNDFNLFLQGFLGHAASWELGDYNYDGIVDTADFDLFLDSYKQQGNSLGQLDQFIEFSPLLSNSQKTSLLSAVPEPSAAAILAASLVICARKRRIRPSPP